MTSPRRQIVFTRKFLCCLFALLLSLTGSLPLSVLPVLAQEELVSDKLVAPTLVKADTEDTDIEFTLSAPSAPDSANPTQPDKSNTDTDSNPVVATGSTTIGAERLQQIAVALGPIQTDQPKQFKFALQSLVKPPVKGSEILPSLTPAPRGAVKPLASKQPLRVTRVSDQGKTDTVRQIAISFNQPMVPLKSAGDIDPAPYLSIQPSPIGTYRWINTQTIIFTAAKDRLPRSTIYTVTIPTSTSSVTGMHLDKPYVFKIETSPLNVLSVKKTEDAIHGLTPLIVAIFDQDIDRATIFKSLALSPASNTKTKIPVKMVDDARILSDATFKETIKTLPKSQWLAFEPLAPLSRGTKFLVNFASGLPSKEGPLKTTESKRFELSTYSALKITTHPENGCSPEPWDGKVFGFSNQLDEKKFVPAFVKLSPAVEDYKIQQNYNSIAITGEFKALTRYQVTFDKSISDIYGQTLGSTQSIAFTTGKTNPDIQPARTLATIPSYGKPVYSLWAQGVPRVKVTLLKVKPTYWLEYAALVQSGRQSQAKGQVVVSQIVPVGQAKKVIDIDLAPHLTKGSGHFIVTVASQGTKPDEACSQTSWLQVTNLGVDVFPGNTMRVLTTNLADGKFVAGATAQILPFATKATTNAQGIAAMPASSKDSTQQAMLVNSGNDSVLVAKEYYDETWKNTKAVPVLTWYTVTDRNLYKVEETVAIKGYIRQTSYSPGDVLQIAVPPVQNISYVATDINGTEIGKGECAVNKSGAFTFTLKIPAKINLGNVNVSLQALPAGNAKINTLLKKVSAIAGDSVESQTTVIKTTDGQTIEPGSTTSNLTFMVQEFRRPEFELKVKSSAGNVLTLGDSTQLTASTKYYSGGTLSETPVNWAVTATQGTYSPPGWTDYRFGINQDIWSRVGIGIGASNTKQYTSKTDANGDSTINLHLDKVSQFQPTNMSCMAEVVDVNRQAWSDTTSILVHPSDTYIGVKSDSYFYTKDKPLDYKIIVSDKDGKAISGRPVSVKLFLTDGDKPDVLKSEQNLVSAESPQPISFKPQPGGNYKVIATVSDSKDRKHQTTIHTWVQGKDPAPVKTVEQQVIKVVPGKDSYQPGDTAEVLILSPFYPASGVLTLRRNSVIQTIPLNLTTSSQSVQVPITTDHFANITLSAQLAGKDAAYGVGEAAIAVKPLARTLSVKTTTPASEYAPGSDSVINIDLKNASGEPVRDGEVAVAVVDESILALSGYNWSDPIDAFYTSVNYGRTDVHSRKDIILRQEALKPKAKAEIHRDRYFDKNPWTRGGGLVGAPVDPRYGQSNEVGQAADAMASLPAPSPMPPPAPAATSAQEPLKVRTDLSALALFEPGLTTDQNGKASVKLHLPDSLTRYRIMVLAASGNDCFGSSTSNITARLPLSIKPSAPRFLTFGDRCQLPVVVQNQTDEPLTTEVVVRASNAELKNRDGQPAVQIASGSSIVGQTQVIPAHDRVEVRFDMATKDIGSINLQCAVIASEKSDAATLSIPVIVPATTEATAAYGQIDGNAGVQSILQKLDIPQDTYNQVGGLTVTTSSTAMQNLLDSYIYLRQYQYNCSEQLSSRIIATLSLQNVLSAFGKLDNADNARIRKSIQQDVNELLTRQNYNGGFGLWSKGERLKWPFVTMQVIEALDLAAARDYKVDSNKLAMAHNLLKDFGSEMPGEYNASARLSIAARLLSLRSALKDNDAKAARALIDKALTKSMAKLKRGETADNVSLDQVKAALPIECAAWLLDVLGKDKGSQTHAKMLRRYIESQVVETASTASVNSAGYGDYNYCLFYSAHRAEAILLTALLKDSPDHPLVAKLAKGLLSKRKNGFWDGPQENHVILKALQQYFAAYEKQNPDLVARMWLNDTFVAEEKYQGRTAESKTVEIPIDYLKQNKIEEFTLSKSGPGRLFYRLALDYSPTSARLKALDCGFAVERTYEGVQNKTDAKKDPDGVWHFKAGAVIRSRIKFVTNGSRYHVALCDPLPAGAEPINGELSGSGVLPPTPASMPSLFGMTLPWWDWPWFEHQNLRDQQAEAFAAEISAGNYEYTYLMRATTPGEFNVPPTKVEEMYETETFGRAASERVIVE